jgi:outer membrane protein assembly factor BamB
VKRILACLAAFLLPVAARAENWPQWRGPENNGISHEKGIPTTWDEKTNILWKAPIPRGNSGSTPAIWGDRIFLTAVDDKDLVVVCLKTDGAPLWKKKIASVGRGKYMGDEGNDAGASPSTDGKNLFVYFATGDLACLDFDGNEVWKLNTQKNYGKFSIQHGMHITPLLHQNRLYVVLLTNAGHWVIALDKANGKEVWKHARKSDAKGEAREAYSSPVLWTTGKEPCLVVLGCDYTTAHRLSDGDEIWRLKDLNPKSNYSAALRIIGSPVATPEELVVPTARGGLIIGLRPGAKGDINPGSPFELWRNSKGAPDVSSPLLYDGKLYLSRENGLFHCWDAVSGKEFYTERRHNDRYRSSPIAVDGKIITNSRDGTFWVIKAGPKYDQLAENKLQDNFTASPVVSGGRLYLRGFNSLYAIAEKK